MTGATLFSGIHAPECSTPEIEWKFCAEIEPFPSVVGAYHHPSVPNLGDITSSDFIERAKEALNGTTLDVLVFGSPCQGFSVAGKRLGLDDPRSNLALHALRIVRALTPAWFIFENVPGLFSNWSGGPPDPSKMDIESAGGTILRDFIESSDFSTFLQYVQDIGYFGAWTILDAQYAGVAQRRERLFFVGHFRDWRYPAAVLLEPESLCGNPPTRQSARERIAPTLEGRAGRSGCNNFATSGGLVEQSFGLELSNQGSGGNVGWFDGDGPSRTLDTNAPPGIVKRERERETIGALCARDSKTVGSQFVNEGKVIPVLRRRYEDDQI
jgi:DNA (cytosine-5)-methyltransferase 1